jgi:hypothetical protein
MRKLFDRTDMLLLWGRGSRFNLARAYFPEIFNNSAASLLDVGCGGTASEWQSAFKNYKGLDFEESYKGIPKEELGDNFVAYNFDDGEIKGVEGADTVICLDVMEHCSNPWRLMESLTGLARNKLIISLPNNWFKFDRQYKKGKASYSGYGLPPNGFTTGQQHKFFFNTEEAIDFVQENLSDGMSISKIVIDLRPGYSGRVYDVPIFGPMLRLVTMPRPAKFKSIFPPPLAKILVLLSSIVSKAVFSFYAFVFKASSSKEKRKFLNQQAAGVWFLIERRS